jgi:hypothetical protein
MDPAGLGALALVGAEWCAIGRLSGVAWPGDTVRVVRWSLYLLSGAFIVGFSQLILSLVGLTFSHALVALALAAAIAAAIRLVARPTPRPRRKTRIGERERYGWALLGTMLAGATLRSFAVPEAGWDAFSHWGLKAQAYAVSGHLTNAGTVHEYYPPLVPLLEAWLLIHRGAISIDVAKTVWPLIGSAFAICLAWHLRNALQRRWLAPFFASAIVLGTAQLLEGFWTGQADLALSTYLCLTTLAVWQWRGAPDRRWLVQAALFAAAAALTKYEALPRLGVLVVAVITVAALERCLSQRSLPALTVALAAALAYLPWLAYRALHGVTTSSEHLSQFQPQALGATLIALLAVFGGIRTGGALLVAAATAVLAGPRLLRPRYRLLTLAVVLQLLATILAFLVSDTAPDVQARTSATRLFAHWLPIALFATALWLDEVPPIIRPGR